MKRVILLGLLSLALGACRKAVEETVQPDYPDWYALRAPEGRAVQAVAGDIDGTLVVSTRFSIYQTKDRGKTWLPSDYTAKAGVEGFLQVADTLLAMTATTGVATTTSICYAISPSYFSLDKGATWQPYRWRWQPNLDPKVALNSVVSPSGTLYETEFLMTPTSTGSTSYYVESIGIKNATGSHLTLPHDHEITSICFDAKSRLYVAASAALCGRRKSFAYCSEPNGILYISKKPQL